MNNLLNNTQNIVDICIDRANNQLKENGYKFLADGETEEINMTYSDLDLKARSIGAMLQERNLSGECAILLYPPGLDFISSYFGCLYSGIIAVPTNPPLPNRSISRLQSIIVDSRAKVILTDTLIASYIEKNFGDLLKMVNIDVIATDNITDDLEKLWKKPLINNDSVAFLQYTSGSTGSPKGVIVTHGNLIYNSSMINKALKVKSNDIGVMWLPLIHDLGLIGGVLQTVYTGAQLILMSPLHFLQKPFRWLQAISKYKATISGGPNFSYDLCIRRVKDAQLSSIDLSSWEVAFFGAETVRADTIDNFTKKFELCNFKKEVFYPSWGMAETTLFSSGASKSESPNILIIDSKELEQDCIVCVDSEQKGSLRIVSCGYSWLEQKIIIVDSETLTEKSENQIGEVWVLGPNVAQGYWKNKKETANTFKGYLANNEEESFLRTGDLGFMHDNELYITGRIKDLIIIHGKNYYPQDIELTVENCHDVLKQNCCGAFSLDIENTEQLVVVVEVVRDLTSDLDMDGVFDTIRKTVALKHEIQVYGILLIKSGTIPRTVSGKVQRFKCKAGFLAGKFKVIGKWSQK